jgi:ectoine hydroxylase-related dioxygenase (phytanoyl-CoA dioxygenase family)
MPPTATLETPTRPAGMTPEQREAFERDGFLVLPSVLNAEEIARFTAAVDALDADWRRDKELDPYATVEIRNAVARPGGEALLPLLDWYATLPFVTDIFGWNIQITTSHVFVRTPNPNEAPTFKAIGWHADGPHPSFPTINGVSPRLYGKIGFFLTDLSEPDRGNLRVVPGSHLSAAKPEIDPATGEPKGAIQVLTKPGDAVFFEQRTWHAVGPNYSNLPRKNVYIGYCYRWMKAIDFVAQPDELLAKANPVQRQLLGDASHELSYYLPSRNDYADVPVKVLTEAQAEATQTP